MAEHGVIARFFLPRRLREPYDWYDVLYRRRLAGSRMSVGGVFLANVAAGNVTAVCLLIALFGVVPGVPLLIAANRDEMYQRPADPITVLRAAQPRILGGRDELAGGTWLAVNEHGVVAGLTNQPTGARDPAKRSRGELPLAFAAYPDAKTAVTEVCARLDPAAYNPCWMLVGDRHALFSVDLSGGHQARVEELRPAATCWRTRRCGSPRPSSDGWPGWWPHWTGPGWTGRDGPGRGGRRRGRAGCGAPGSSARRRSRASRARRPGAPGRTVSRLRAYGALWHPLCHDRQRGPGGRAAGQRRRRAAVRDPAAGCDRDVGLARGPARLICADC